MKPLSVLILIVPAFAIFKDLVTKLKQEIRRNEEILKISRNVGELKARSMFSDTASTLNPYLGHYRDKPKDFEKYLTAMMVVNQKNQAEYLERNKHLHAYMKPFLEWVPTSDFRGHVVEYGPLIQLQGCDPRAPRVPCGNQRDLGILRRKTDRHMCARFACCWDEKEQLCHRKAYKNLSPFYFVSKFHF